jgi:ABC-2 type transport system ATP-binding protein
MLGLLRALAGRHGKSLILSTHLLGDINRVCEQVIIVDRGTVLGVGKISELRAKHQGRYRLRWRGAGTAFLDALRAEGINVEANGRTDEAIVDVPGTWPTRRFFELATLRDVTLRDLSPLEEDLEELYHRVIGGQRG